MEIRAPRDRRLVELLKKAIDHYNRYKAPEARAILLEARDGLVRVLFKGSFCWTCGINDWVEDFKYVLEDLGAKAELVEVIEPEDDLLGAEDWRIGVFRVRLD
ncbi:MAG: hypothetical protein ABWW69_03250 [Pyrodictiaceae archaeon]